MPGISCVKIVMFIFNFLLALVGLVMLLSTSSFSSQFVENRVLEQPIILIVAGSIVLVLAFYGCCGAMRESSCMVTTFAVLLMVLLVAETTFAVMAFLYGNNIQNELTEYFTKQVANYGYNSTSDADMDDAQAVFECCGANGPEDYAGRPLPRSCCVNSVCPPSSDVTQIFQAGCSDVLKNIITSVGLVIACFAIVVTFVLIMGIISGLSLASYFRNKIRTDDAELLLQSEYHVVSVKPAFRPGQDKAAEKPHVLMWGPSA